MKAVLQAMAEEIAAMRSGHFMPYHKLALMIAVLTCTVFSVVFAHGVVVEGRIAVVDLDRSHLSEEIIRDIGSSVFINVAEVYHNAVDPVKVTAHDRVLGVLYLPPNLQQDVMSGHRSINLGYFADFSNEAQNAEVISTLSEMIPQIGQGLSVSRVAALGLAQNETRAAVEPLHLVTRRMFNPTYSATSSTVVSFIFFFSAIYLGLTSLMVMSRMRVTGRFDAAIRLGPLSVFARMVPYALFYTTATTLVNGLLICFGQLNFAGSILAFVPLVFLCAMCVCMFCYVLSWNAPDPGIGAAYMILIVPPGFITGGFTMATGFLPDWAYLGSHAFPLVWVYKFFRDLGFRGINVSEMLPVIGWFLVYFSVLGLLVLWRWRTSMRRITEPVIKE